MSANGASAAGYSSAAKWLHWIMAACIIMLIPLGIALDKVPEGPLQDRLFNLHRSFGVLALVLAILRVSVRRLRGAPPHDPGLTRFEQIASTAVHHSLYALILLTPLFGWAMMSTYRADVPVFGLFNLPNILPQNDAASKIFAFLHGTAGKLMMFVVIAHVGAALMHFVIKRDGVMHRMLPNAWGVAATRLQSVFGKPQRSA